MEKIGYFIGGYNSETPEFNGNGQTAKSRIQSFGLENNRVSVYEKIVYIAIDHSDVDLRKARNLGIDSAHSVLVINEPKVVRPTNFDSQVQSNYGFIVVVGGNPSEYKTTINWPQPWRLGNTGEITNRIQKPVIVISNRISFIQGENYSLRRKVVSELGVIDYFGRDWDYSFNQKLFHLMSNAKIALQNGFIPKFQSMENWFRNFPNSGGEIPSKDTILQKYKYSITIENSNGYLSEKLFDCFFNSTIPIYVGPNPAEYGIPEELVIHCPGDFKSVVDGIYRARELDYKEWCKKLDQWLRKPETFESWESNRVYSVLSQKIKDYCTLL